MQAWQRRSGGRISRRRLLCARAPCASPCCPVGRRRSNRRLPPLPRRRHRRRCRLSPSACSASPSPAASPPAASGPSPAAIASIGLAGASSFTTGRTPAASCAPWSRSRSPGSGRSCRGPGDPRDRPAPSRTLAVLRIGIAGLAAHGARQLGAALVGPGPLAAGAAAGPLDVLELAVDVEAALAHAARRLGRRLAREAGVELIAARPGPGLLAARGAAADLAIGDAPNTVLHSSHIRRGGSLGLPVA